MKSTWRTLGLLVSGILLSGVLHAQPKIYFSTGIAKYNLSDLRAIQNANIGTIKLQPVSNFPAYVNYETGAYIGIGEHLLTSISVGYGSTGARSMYADYSGSVTLDQRVHYFSIGSSFGLSMNYDDKYIMMYELKVGAIMSKLRIDERESLGSASTSDFETYTATSGYLQPTITATRRFGSFGVDVYLAYNMNVRFSMVKSDTNDNAYLAGNNGYAKIDWSGLRAGAGVSLFFHRKED